MACGDGLDEARPGVPLTVSFFGTLLHRVEEEGVQERRNFLREHH